LNLAILHLSDIHFAEGTNPVSSRAAKIASALVGLGRPPDAVRLAHMEWAQPDGVRRAAAPRAMKYVTWLA
jgi:hypothetical protein